jgi:hypothetical protein
MLGQLAATLCDTLGMPGPVGLLVSKLVETVVTTAFPGQVAAAKMAALVIRTVGAVLYDGPGNPFAAALVHSLGREVADAMTADAKTALGR